MPIIHHFNREGFYIEDVRIEETDGEEVYLVHAMRMHRDAATEKSRFLPTLDSEHSPENVRAIARRGYDRFKGPEVFMTYYADPGVKRGDYRLTLPEGIPISVEQPTAVEVPLQIDDFVDDALVDLGISR